MRKVIAVILWVITFVVLCFGSAPAYQIELDYYTVRTQDTVTPKGIYHDFFIYINAPPASLDRIDYVKYRLDGEFLQPELISRSRAHDFQIEVKALSHFSATASVHLKNGKKLSLDRYILLGAQKPKRERVHKVFLNHIPEENPRKNKSVSVALFIYGSQAELAQINRIEYYFPPEYKRKPIIINRPAPDHRVRLKLSEETIVEAYVYFRDGTVSEHVRFIYFKYY